MEKEIHIPVSYNNENIEQEIILAPAGRSKKNFFVWLCQGTYDAGKEDWSTQFCIPDTDLNIWIKHLTEIRDSRESYLGQLQIDIRKEIAEAADAFTVRTGKSPKKLCVCEKVFREMVKSFLKEVTSEGGEEFREKLQKAEQDMTPVDMIMFGMKVVRRFDEVSEEEGFILE